MSAPHDPAELELVKGAISCGLGGCCVWDEKALRLFSSQKPLPEMTGRSVVDALIQHVKGGGAVIQVVETRPEWNDMPFYYKVILPHPGLPRGLFVEIRLEDDDPNVPSVLIVNAHEQRA